MKLNKILVPLDGSRLAEAALPTAIDLLRDRATSTVVLLRAAEASWLPGTDQTDEQVRVIREAEEYLEVVAAGLRRDGVKNVKPSVWYGPAAATIIEAAEVGKIDLIVMSTHGRSGLGRLILGSVAEAVLRGTRTPILIVRDNRAPVFTPPGEAHARAETLHV